MREPPATYLLFVCLFGWLVVRCVGVATFLLLFCALFSLCSLALALSRALLICRSVGKF